VPCMNHGDSSSHASSDCERSDCDCRKCVLIGRRREVTNKLMRLRAKTAINNGDFDARYTCFKCRIHGVKSVKKFHTPCPFAHCRCPSCELNEERRRICREISLIQQEENNKRRSSECSHSDESPRASPEIKEIKEAPSLSSDAKVILDLLNVLAIDPTHFNTFNFDFDALAQFFSQPTLMLPEEWLPEWPEIVSLVHEAL
ncbi:hypothetical protein PMAYCL1PPCAC_14052, partial [Pristionchus mayeri]